MSVRKNFILLSAFMLIPFSFSVQAAENQPTISPDASDLLYHEKYSPFLGEWSASTYDADDKAFSSLSINIGVISSFVLEGEYCYIRNYGAQADCWNDFEGYAIDDMQYLITFNN